MKKNTVRAKLAAFKWAHATLWGRGQVDMAMGSVLYLTERAVSWRAEDRKPKLAVGREGLAALAQCDIVRQGGDKDLQLWAWWLLSYRAFLRCSEAARIKWEDVQFQVGDDGVRVLCLRQAVSGRQSFKNHAESVEFRIRSVGGDLCAVRAVVAWCRCRGRPRSGPVFQMSTEEARAAFQEGAAGCLGGNPSQYGLHSLRAGAATDAEAEGRPVSEIKFLGRWQSASVLQYMRAGEQLAAEYGLPRAGDRGVRVV